MIALIGVRTTPRTAWKAAPMKPAIPSKIDDTVFATMVIALLMNSTVGEMTEFQSQLKAVPIACSAELIAFAQSQSKMIPKPLIASSAAASCPPCARLRSEHGLHS